jgi:hypothetical protein
MTITKVLKPEELNAVRLVQVAVSIVKTSRADDSLLDLTERILDALVAEGILG